MIIELHRGRVRKITAIKDNSSPFQKYTVFLGDWYQKLNSYPEDSFGFWLAEAMRTNLPEASKPRFKHRPKEFSRAVVSGLDKIRKTVVKKELSNPLFMKFSRQALKIRELFNGTLEH